MGIQNPQTISLSLPKRPADNVLDSSYQVPPQAVFWPSENVLPQIFPMRKMTAPDDSPADAYHKNSLPGVPWAYPYLAMLGSGPKYYVLRKGPAGMFVNNGTFDANGKYTVGNAGVVEWPNPVAGTYEVVVDVFDQQGQLTWRHEHVCGDASKHIIVSVGGSGTGDGSSAANAMSWANAYLGDTTLSPTQGKVLHLIGGSYPAIIYQIFPQYHSRNIVHYAADNPANGKPKFQCRFNDQGSHRFISGIEWNDMTWGYDGIIQTGVNAHNFISWRNRFINIRNTADGGNDNEACHMSTGSGGSYFRRGYVVHQNYYEDVEVSATTMFSLEDAVNTGENFVINSATITDRLLHPAWFSKAGCRYVMISDNVFNCPTVNGGSVGVITIQNSATNGSFSRGFAENNYIRCNGGIAIKSNGGANGLPIDAINWIRRNSVIGGAVDARNFDTAAGQSRFTYFDSNAIQNSDSANAGISASAAGYSVARHECVGASGVLDTSGNLTPAFSSYKYKRGFVQGK